MSVTHRETMTRFLPFALWLLLVLLCTVAGPFGTHAVLTMAERFAYWGIVVAISIGGSFLAMRLEHPTAPARNAAIWVAYVAAIVLAVSVLNYVSFGIWNSWAELGQLLVNIAVTVAVIKGGIALAQLMLRPQEPSVDPQVVFLRRVPLELRAPLIRIEAQDHYLKVVTEKGAATILLRLAEAVDQLSAVDGLQVHRSHWVRTGAVARHQRREGRDLLELANGDVVPVSRSFRGAAQAAGLITR